MFHDGAGMVERTRSEVQTVAQDRIKWKNVVVAGTFEDSVADVQREESCTIHHPCIDWLYPRYTHLN